MRLDGRVPIVTGAALGIGRAYAVRLAEEGARVVIVDTLEGSGVQQEIASEQIEGSSPFAMHVKGLELPGYDPRGMKGQGLTYALSDRGECHIRSNTIRTELLGLPQAFDQYGYEGKPAMVRDLQLAYVTFYSLIACLFGA